MAGEASKWREILSKAISCLNRKSFFLSHQRTCSISLLTCIGEFPLSTLSMPSAFAPPPNKAVTIFRPTEMMLAQGDGAMPLSMSSDLVGTFWMPFWLKNICMTIPNESEDKTVNSVTFHHVFNSTMYLTCWTMKIHYRRSGSFGCRRRCRPRRLSSKRSTSRRTCGWLRAPGRRG